jgi:hypothetical protein
LPAEGHLREIKKEWLFEEAVKNFHDSR